MSEFDIERYPVKSTDTQIKELSIKLTNTESELSSLREEKNSIQWEFDKLKSKEYHQSYTVENQRKVIENLKKTLERFEHENKALRALVGLWV